MSALGKSETEPREALATAIRRHTAATERIARINEAAGQISVWTASEAVEQAEAALKDARKGEQKRLVAKLLGDPAGSAPTIEEAEEALADAKTSLELAQRSRDALDGQRRAAEAELAWAKSGVRDAIAKVVHAEGAANAVVAQYLDARREVARLREILSFLSGKNCVPAYWDSVGFFPPSNAEAPWRVALAALESDAEAELP